MDQSTHGGPSGEEVCAATIISNPGCLIFIDTFRTGFFQAMPFGSVLTNSIDQMLIEGTPLEARHGKG